jgi:hypothetical protein
MRRGGNEKGGLFHKKSLKVVKNLVELDRESYVAEPAVSGGEIVDGLRVTKIISETKWQPV